MYIFILMVIKTISHREELISVLTFIHLHISNNVYHVICALTSQRDTTSLYKHPSIFPPLSSQYHYNFLLNQYSVFTFLKPLKSNLWLSFLSYPSFLLILFSSLRFYLSESSPSFSEVIVLKFSATSHLEIPFHTFLSVSLVSILNEFLSSKVALSRFTIPMLEHNIQLIHQIKQAV